MVFLGFGLQLQVTSIDAPSPSLFVGKAKALDSSSTPFPTTPSLTSTVQVLCTMLRLAYWVPFSCFPVIRLLLLISSSQPSSVASTTSAVPPLNKRAAGASCKAICSASRRLVKVSCHWSFLVYLILFFQDMLCQAESAGFHPDKKKSVGAWGVVFSCPLWTPLPIFPTTFLFGCCELAGCSQGAYISPRGWPGSIRCPGPRRFLSLLSVAIRSWAGQRDCFCTSAEHCGPR